MPRPRALTLALSLAAGALLTWAAAWSCALWADAPSLDWDVDAPITPWPRGTPADWPQPNCAWSAHTSCRSTYRWAATPPPSIFREGGHTAAVYEFGWPFRALAFTELDGGPTFEHINRIDPADVPAWTSASNYDGLPLRILPARFTLNTLLYAATLLATFELLSLTRRRLRARRNHCPTCNYNRAGLTANASCPECGRTQP